MKKLNADQRKLVEENHNLIYGFLHSRNLDIDEYYGLIAESICKAALHWNYKRGKFSTFFYRVAVNDLYKHWGRTTKVLESEFEFEVDEVESSFDLDYQINKIELLDSLKGTKCDEIVPLLLEGYTQTEVADILGIHRMTVTRRLQKLREVYNDGKEKA